MPSRPGPGTSWVLFRVFGTGDMKEWSNDFWYSVTAGAIVVTTNFGAITNAFYSQITTSWPAAITTHETIRGCIAYFNNGVGTFSWPLYSDVAGTGISQPMPEDVAVIVRKETADFTPSGKGRWFFYGAGQGDVNGSYLNASGQTDWQQVALDAQGAIVAGGITLSPAHFSPTTGLLYPIRQTPVLSLLGTRRRRRGPF